MALYLALVNSQITRYTIYYMKQQRGFSLFLILGDITALYAALGITLLLRYGTDLAQPWEFHRIPFALLFAIWIAIFFIVGLYEQQAWSANRAVIERLVRAITAAGITSALLFYFVPAFVITPKTNLLIQIMFSIAFIIGWRRLASILIRNTTKTKVLFFGMSDEIAACAALLQENPHLGYTVVTAPSNESIPELIKAGKVSLVVASQDIRSNKEFVRMLYDVLHLGIGMVDFPTFYESLTGKVPVSLISEVWFLENLVAIRKGVYEYSKRLVDILLAIAAGLVGILLFPFIALGIILSTPHEVFNYKQYRARPGDGILFFRQKRVGKNGNIFNFVKFRSQRLGAEKMSEAKSAENDQRHYPFGKLLRAFYLDELPQILNVLKGEMSFTGPRPERPEYVKDLRQSIPFYEVRLLVPPGITGWAQLNMKNDASVEDAPEKLQYDLYYIKNRSLALDLTIALKTIAVMLSRAGR